jgi:hypothetical protein
VLSSLFEERLAQTLDGEISSARDERGMSIIIDFGESSKPGTCETKLFKACKESENS